MNPVSRHNVRQLNGISSSDQETNLRIMMCRCVVSFTFVLMLLIEGIGEPIRLSDANDKT
jgi:hypothetical protein